MTYPRMGANGASGLSQREAGSRALDRAVKIPAARHVRPGRRILGWALLAMGVALVVAAWA